MNNNSKRILGPERASGADRSEQGRPERAGPNGDGRIKRGRPERAKVDQNEGKKKKNKKYCALRLDVGNFSWGFECCTRKTRIIDLVYNASSNEFVCTKTLMKNSIVLIDATLYGKGTSPTMHCPWATKKGGNLTPEEEEFLNKQTRDQRKFKRNMTKGKRMSKSAVFRSSSSGASFSPAWPQDQASVAEQMAMCSEGKEMEFYLWKIKARKGK